MKKLVVKVIAVASLSFSQAHAAVIYDFSGGCSSGCVGLATGVLTLADTYIPGTPVAVADFVSWAYASSDGTVFDDSMMVGLSLILPSTSGVGTGDITFGPAASRGKGSVPQSGDNSGLPGTNSGLISLPMVVGVMQ